MTKIIEDINLQKLKNLTLRQKKQLASEIRTFLIYNISKTGGHLSSNLGIVELVIALHSVVCSPDDIIIFDVGHQSYVHKILTNRMNKFATLRKKNGLSGFIDTSESQHDIWESGHSSTSISAAIAYALANPTKTICVVIGDSSIVNGVSLEAINHLGELNLNNVIIILNDNDMSISQPSGGFSKELSSINKDTVATLSHFNVDYQGPFDGHDINLIEQTLQKQIDKNKPGSAILHFKTIKGKGYYLAENDTNGSWHGVGVFDLLNPSNDVKKDNKILWAQIVADQVEFLMRHDKSIFVTTPAMALGSKLSSIAKNYPNRFFDVGISEEHAVCFNAALGETGKIKPFLAIYSSFLQRGYDFLLTDLVRKNNHVVIGLDRCGFVGEDGATHHGLWDVSFMKAFPNTTILAPSNAKECFEMLKFAFSKKQGLFVIRYEKDLIEPLNNFNLDPVFKIDWKIIQPIKKVNVISFGRSLRTLMQAKVENIGIINANLLNKIDSGIIYMLNQTELIVVEEIIENNSLYEQIVKFCYEHKLNIKLHKINVTNAFAPHATQQEQLREAGLSLENIKEVINNIYERIET